MSYTEYTDSQKPAMELLKALGWQYLTPDEALEKRGGLQSEVILDDILKERLQAFNRFEYKDKVYPFSSQSINAAVHDIKNVRDQGLMQANEAVYDLLTIGESYDETIAGDTKGYTINFIDWENPENNVYHFTDEFQVEGPSEKRRPDIVLFINGIPLVVMENKRRDKNYSIDEAVSQNIRNQRPSEGIPRLFYYSQLLFAVHPNIVKYATTGTKADFWSVWKEDNEAETAKLLVGKRLPTEQDRTIAAMLNINRLMDFIYKFIVFDGPEKKIARYQQYFAVKKTLKTVKQKGDKGRNGGVLWHTQGSGKSLTMVMLSKSLALDPEIKHPRVIIVTDRIDLDKQIHKTFRNCGKAVKKARSGSNLIELLEDKGNEIVTTIVNKFQTAVKKTDFRDTSENIFVLVDESHRSQSGFGNSNMKRMLPNACYLGFTGTPLTSKEKSTIKKFGGLIDEYSIKRAVEDGAVLPLIYEGRAAKLNIDKELIDKWYDRETASMTKDAQADLKKKMSTITQIYMSKSVVEEIAYDISEHYTKYWKGTGLKAQLAVPRVNTAVMYQKFFENQKNPKLKINTKVVFTSPDTRKGNEDVWAEASEESMTYWKTLMSKHGNQEDYEEWVLDKFKSESDEVELIIVVSKLLTGFDAPRNTILYLAKPLAEHNLLQAIARVNRLFEGKDYGQIIDYVGLLSKLNDAFTKYEALAEFNGLEGFDESDIEGTIVDAAEKVDELEHRLADIWDIFKPVKNKKDLEALERHLEPKDIRDKFYETVTAYSKTLQLALSTDTIFDRFSYDKIDNFKRELKFFTSLRGSVQVRYAEVIDYKEYEPRIRKLIDTYVKADSIEVLVKDVNIFDENMVNEALETYGKTPASKADLIANHMKKVINENMDKDEAYYKKFSQLIEEVISDYKQQRITELQYLEKIKNLREDFANGRFEGIPDNVLDNVKSRAFYGAVKQVFDETKGKEFTDNFNELIGQFGNDITNIVESKIIRDWKRNIDVQRAMENEIEDYLIDHRRDLGMEISYAEIDDILAKCIKVAKNNY